MAEKVADETFFVDPQAGQKTMMGAETVQVAETMMSLPAVLSLFVEVGQFVLAFALQLDPQLARQVFSGLQLMALAVSEAGVNVMLIFDALTPEAAEATTVAICWTVTAQLLLPLEQLLPRVEM